MFSGGKDGAVFCIDLDSLSATVRCSYDSPVRAIDVDASDSMIVGLRNGSIIRGQNEVLMFSHSDGEVWGLDVSDYPMVCTSGDDNKVIVWNT